MILALLILDQYVRVECDNAGLEAILLANYGALRAEPPQRLPDLNYRITGDEASGFSLHRRGRRTIAAHDAGDLLFLLEKDCTVALQRRRPDLLFLHAAALEFGGKAYLLAGDSGSGKSATAWGLLHHGFRYLSDELSAIDLAAMRVLPYPHALCLKEHPPSAYPLPASGVLDLGRTLHVPAQSMPDATLPGPCDLEAIFFLQQRGASGAPVLRPISPAQASARMYVVALNALAHPGRGLDAVTHVASRLGCFVLQCADLRATCRLIARRIPASDAIAQTSVKG